VARDRDEVEARLAEEKMDDEVVEAARSGLLTFATYMKKHFKAAPHLELVCAALERVERGECKRLIINMPPQHGKLVADSVPVLTPKGWTTHGELKVGDEVFGLDGRPTKILGFGDVSYASMIVKTCDGAEIKVHPNHEWQVYSRRSQKEQVIETKKMRAAGVQRVEKRGDREVRRSIYMLPRRPVVQFGERELPVHPYVFGAWLGDGSAAKGCITHDPRETEVIARVVECGYPIVGVWTHKTTGVLTTNFGPKLNADLRATGAWENKHVPDAYKFSSAAQRLELLAGLIDTDGSVDANGRVRIVTADERLANDIVEVVRSLGMRAAITTAQPCLSTSGIKGAKPVHYVAFNPSLPIPTQLKRKATDRLVQPDREGIDSITPCEPEPGKCICVEAPDGIYLVGRELVPTHNTEIVSRLFPAWYFGRNPSRAVLFATHTATYAEKIGRNVRNNIGSEEFRRVFPDVSLAEDSKAASAFEIVPGDGFRVKRGQWAAYGMGGSYTGSTAELLIFDDLLTEQDSNSETALETAYESIEALYSRLADKTGAWVVVNTRYNLRDVVAYLTREYAGEGWEILSLPAVAEAEEEFKLPSGKTWQRHVGDALFPDRFSIERLTAIMNQRLQTNAPSWWGQYQCRPVPADGNIVKWSWFDSRRYHDSPAILALGCTRVVVSVDTSKGASDKAARTAISVWGEHAGRTFLLDSWAKAIPYTEQRQRLKDTCGRWRPQVMLIEDKSTGEALIDDLRKSTDWVRTPIVGVKPRGSKEERMQAVTPQMADGQVWIPRDGHPECRWLQAFAEEMSLYPKGVFRDQGDTVSQYLRWRGENSSASLTGFNNENAENARRAFGGSWGRPGGGWGRPRRRASTGAASRPSALGCCVRRSGWRGRSRA
jgi:predicted phage terminase large subunit-like protein